jgi:glycosyltransferase involved in cell wall biosynthesis
VVHAQGYRNYFTEASAIYSKRSQFPLVITPGGSLLGYKFMSEGVLEELPNLAFDLVTRRRALNDSVVVPSSAAEAIEATALGVSPQRIRIIPHGVDFARLPTPPSRNAGSGERLLFVGRITEARNLKFLLRGFAQALRKRPSLRLTVVGDPIPGRYNVREKHYPSEVASLASQLGLSSQVIFRGGLYGSSLYQAYADHDVFVYTSRYDNFGYALVEAAYFGLPIISTDVGVAADLVREGLGGFLVSHDQDADLADAIHRATSDPRWRASAIEFLRQQCRRFSLEADVEAHENLYNSLVQLRGGARNA